MFWFNLSENKRNARHAHHEHAWFLKGTNDMEDIVLLESASLRQKLCTEENLSVLEKVGQLVLLPHTGCATTESLAAFYQVPVKTIEKVVERNKEEFLEDGYKIVSAKEFRDRQDVGLKSKSRSLALHPRKACLRVGMLLTNSEIAKEVRSYLLRIEERSGLTNMGGGHDLAQMAEELQQHAIQIGRHSNQLIAQAGLIKAIVGEINRHGDSIKSIEKRCDSFDRRILSLEHNREPAEEKIEYITPGQMEILQAKVRQLGRAITVWKRFNKFFGLSRYKFLPREKFQEAMDWLEAQGKN